MNVDVDIYNVAIIELISMAEHMERVPETTIEPAAAEAIEFVEALPSAEVGKSHPMAHVAAELFDAKNSRLDAKLVAQALDLPFAQIARVLDVSPSQIQRDPSGRSLQEDLGKIAFCYSTLKRVLGTREQARIWLNAPHPDLGARSPISVMKERKTDVIVTLLRNALAGQMS